MVGKWTAFRSPSQSFPSLHARGWRAPKHLLTLSQHLSIAAMVKPLVIVLEALRVPGCLSPLNSIKWTQCDLDQRTVRGVLYRLQFKARLAYLHPSHPQMRVLGLNITTV